jgi:hypothetical protein
LSSRHFHAAIVARQPSAALDAGQGTG